MQLVRNLGKADRFIRIAAGVLMLLVAGVLAPRGMLVVLLVVAGVSILASAALGH